MAQDTTRIIVPATQPFVSANANGKQQTENHAGGFVFRVDDNVRLTRLLCMGTESGTYHIGDEQLNIENAQCIKRLIASGRGAEVVEMVIQYSKAKGGRTAKQNALMLAIAMSRMCARQSVDLATKKLCYENLHHICRIPTQLFMFIDYCEKRQHRSRPLPTNQLKKVARMSDMAYFEGQLLEPFMVVRVSDTPAHKKVQQHIKNYMTKYGWTVEEDAFTDNTPLGRKHFTNIVATQNPKAIRRLVLACHYDSKYFAKFVFIGATDSAVPCAMLLDVARHLNTSLWKHGKPMEEDVSLQLVFFDGEEAFVEWNAIDSIYGARHIAKEWSTSQRRVDREQWANQLETMDVLVLLDLIGAKDPQFNSWFKNTEHLFERFKKIEMRLIKMGLLEHVDPSQSHNQYFTSTIGYTSGGIEDDHIPFLHKNVPVLHMIAYPFPHEWHKDLDNKDALHFSSIDNINKILRAFVCEYLHLTP